MKKKYLALAVFLSGSCVLYAQQGFDSKKKKKEAINTSSLQARTITGHGSATGISTMNSLPGISWNTSTRINTPHTILALNTHGLPRFIETKRDPKSSARISQPDVPARVHGYLKELEGVLQLDPAKNDFRITRSKTSGDETHVWLQQYYREVPIYGAEIAIHLNQYGEGKAFNGNYYKSISNDVTPAVPARVAVQNVIHDLNTINVSFTTGIDIRNLVQYETPHTTLYWYENNTTRALTLAYQVIACPAVDARWEYFVDASTGAILNKANTICFADGPRTTTASDLNNVSRSINTYQKGSFYYLLDTSRPMFNNGASSLPDNPVGGILTVDMNNTFGNNTSISHLTTSTNSWTNKKAVSAHFNAGFAYDYYRTKHNRNSIDGSGGTIISIINVPDENGNALDNAYWNGKAMFYGNGNTAFKALAGALDVAGHEMTHGVVQNTANLTYQGESGAINESMADIFGTMMDPADWLIGEDVVNTSAFPSGALRSLSDPHNGATSLGQNGYQPSHVNEAYTGNEDNGGVHINSGIPNNAFYRFATATTRAKAAAVFYKALDDYLTKSSQFIDLRLAVIKAAGDLYGTSSAEVTQAGAAFDAVGITNGTGGNYTETLPANPGTEYYLVYNTDSSDPNTLYRSSIDGKSATALTKTLFTSRPSVTDDGSVAVFVAADHTIHAITTTPNEAPNEFVLQNEAIWSNAVISKGGKRLAAVTKDSDKLIYVYDFDSRKWVSFTLYNPTYSDGVKSGGPQYADALEWDYTGEYLVYDAFNTLVNNDGSNIEYWDVNFIHAWDKAGHTFADGTISKLFSSLPDGISIGNPSFAKNTPNVIAFDYIDSGLNEYAILGCNIETSDINIIATNNTLGWPSFNKNDTHISFTADNGSGNYKTSYVTLNGDKISSPGTKTDIYDFTKWAVHFSTGTRATGDDEVTGLPEDHATTSLTCYPNPFKEDIVVAMNETHLTLNSTIQMITLEGQTRKDFTIEQGNPNTLVLRASALPPGLYHIVYQQGNKRKSVCRVLKEK